MTNSKHGRKRHIVEVVAGEVGRELVVANRNLQAELDQGLSRYHRRVVW